MQEEALKILVIESIVNEIQTKASLQQQHEDLRAILRGSNEGRELELTILTGGLCNYSFRLHFKDRNDANNDNTNDVSLFVKMTFGNTLLFPGVDISLERLGVEFQMLELFHKISPHPESAIVPYLCFDIADDGDHTNTNNSNSSSSSTNSNSNSNNHGTMKVLVTQFSSRLQEQAAHFFIDGTSPTATATTTPSFTAKALATEIASGLASLHNAEVTEPNLNEKHKDYSTSLMDMSKRVFASYLREGNRNSSRNSYATNARPKAKAKAIGREGLDKITTACYEQIMRSDCYVHGDCHLFNMLVEGNDNDDDNTNGNTNDNTNDETATPIGDVAFIDWEFAHVGAMGKDLGWVCGFPIACLLAHALQGGDASVQTILEFLDVLWETYASAIRPTTANNNNTNNNNSHLSLRDVYRQVMGSLGRILGAYSAVGMHMEYLPIEVQRQGSSNDDDNDDDDDDDNDNDERTKIRESLGVLSLEVFEIAFLDGDGDDGTSTASTTIEELRERFGRALQTEVRHLSPPPPKKEDEPPTPKQQQQEQQQQQQQEQEQQRPSLKRKQSSLRLSGHRVSDAHMYYSISSSLKRTQSSYEDLDDLYGSFYDDSTTATAATEDTTTSATTTATTPQQHGARHAVTGSYGAALATH